MLSGGSLLIAGQGGTGKSTLRSEVLAQMSKRKRGGKLTEKIFVPISSGGGIRKFEGRRYPIVRLEKH